MFKKNQNIIKNLLMYLPFLGIFFITLWATNPIASTAATRITYYVSPDGIDINSGISLLLPFKTIQQAINVAQPGDIINLKSGEYREDIVSRRDGTADNPITITGSADAIVRGGGNDRVIEINHNYHTLNGFTVDGLYGLETKSSGYRDTLMYVLGKKVRQGVEGLKVTNMVLKNSGGECLRLRYFATKAEIAYNTITNCGVQAFVFNTGGKNGEGIYLGTSNKQWGDGKNPTSDPDETRDNVIHHNYIDTQGNECVDIKEVATANIIEYNTCRGQKDSESGGFDSRGDGNIFRYNDVRESIGGGIRLGGAYVNDTQYGKNNDVYENTIIDNKNGGIRFQITPQGKICGNTMSGNINGNSAGNFGSEFDPTKSCGNNISSDNTGNTNEPPNFDTAPSDLTTTPSAMGLTTRGVQTALFTKPLYQGLYNQETRQLQTVLSRDASLYPEGLITGYFSLLTKKAVRRFQCKYGIICNGDESTTGYGRVGPKTLQKLNQLNIKNSSNSIR